jgi:hypothetical protein
MGRIGLSQCRGRGYREEGCGYRDQDAVKSSTVLRTVTHHFTPWAEPFRHGMVLYIVCLKLFAGLIVPGVFVRV